MQSKRAILAILGVCLLGCSRPAYAQRGMWEWLQRLSGPGSFNGLSGEFPVVCFTPTPTGDGKSVFTHKYFIPCWYPKQPDSKMPWMERPLYFSFYIGWFKGGATDLKYSVEPLSRNVKWFRLGGTFTWSAHPSFDIHTGATWNRLSNGEDVFPSFSFAGIELMGINWRPCFKCSWPWRGVEVPLRATLLARSFDAADFGAIPGTFHTGPEVQFQWGIVFDFWSR